MAEIDECRSCKFWAAEVGMEPQYWETWTNGRCKRHAPVTPVITTSRSDAERPVWPQTEGRDWCGDYFRIRSFPTSGQEKP